MLPQVSTHASLLARLAQGGDSQAWNEFHDRYRELVWSFARRRGFQPADADDVVQEVLLAVNRGVSSFDYDPARGRFRGWLKTVALRAMWKRQHREDAVTGALDAEAAFEVAARDGAIDSEWELEWRRYHLRLAVARASSEFNARDLRAFELVSGEGRSAAEAGTALGMSPDQVYQAKSRILKRLKSLIAEQIADEG